jgi:nicotinamidase-related amidase
MKALIVVDLQYDFVPPDGKLAVPGGAELPEVELILKKKRNSSIIITLNN